MSSIFVEFSAAGLFRNNIAAHHTLSRLRGPFLARAEHLPQGARIANSVATNIVIEIDIRCRQLRVPSAQSLRPDLQIFPRIVTAIPRPTPVKADIAKVCGQLLRPRHSMPVVNTKGDIIAAQQFVDRRNTPTLVPELQRISMTTRQDSQKLS